MDTGSSDTWLVETGFKCVDVTTSDPEPESYCAFGPTYNVSDTFKQVPDENFNITYGDGEFLTGILGRESVTLAGIEVGHTAALVNYAAWEGDGTTSGLMGLAYPALYGSFPTSFFGRNFADEEAARAPTQVQTRVRTTHQPESKSCTIPSSQPCTYKD